MCFKNKSIPSRDDYVDLKELKRLINSINFEDPLYFSIVEAKYPGAGKIRLLSSLNPHFDQQFVSFKQKLDVYAAKVPSVCISYKRILRDKMDKPFSRYHTETVWKVYFDNNQSNTES